MNSPIFILFFVHVSIFLNGHVAQIDSRIFSSSLPTNFIISNRHDRSDTCHKPKISSIYVKYFTDIGTIVPIMTKFKKFLYAAVINLLR